MTFALKMIARLTLVALLLLSGAVVWIVDDVGKSLRDDVDMTAERVAWLIQDRARLNTGTSEASVMLAALKTMGPGICIDVVGAPFDEHHFCSGWADIGGAGPDWFHRVFGAFFQPGSAASRAFMVNGQLVGLVNATADPEAMKRRAWAKVRLVTLAAVIMTTATGLIALLVVGHALLPARALIRGMRRLEEADYSARLPSFDQPEFRRIAQAFNDLADRLQTTSDERAALTRRLFHVQEEERRALARELHDEFGQCLTSTGALAASIESGATPDRPDLVADAHAIGDIVARMTVTLRSALERLRPPDLDLLGLEGSIRQLVGLLKRRFGPKISFGAEIADDLPGLSQQASLAVYRIAQEGLTNAVRHGAPSMVRVRLTRGDDAGVLLAVEDDGAGPSRPESAPPGHGILGMRERVAALGGRLAIDRDGRGFRIAALIPAGSVDG